MAQTLTDTHAAGGDRLHSLDEARQLLGGISRSSLYELMDEGRLGTVHIGRRRFIPQSEIDKFIAGTMVVRP